MPGVDLHKGRESIVAPRDGVGGLHRIRPPATSDMRPSRSPHHIASCAPTGELTSLTRDTRAARSDRHATEPTDRSNFRSRLGPNLPIGKVRCLRFGPPFRVDRLQSERPSAGSTIRKPKAPAPDDHHPILLNHGAVEAMPGPTSANRAFPVRGTPTRRQRMRQRFPARPALGASSRRPRRQSRQPPRREPPRPAVPRPGRRASRPRSRPGTARPCWPHPPRSRRGRETTCRWLRIRERTRRPGLPPSRAVRHASLSVSAPPEFSCEAQGVALPPGARAHCVETTTRRRLRSDWPPRG